jgi:stalled ribosome rescue protein Dom34
VAKVKRKQGYKRGYPVALLVSFEDDRAVLWHVFSHIVKLHFTVELSGRITDERALYNFHESIVNALRPTLKEGVRSIILTSAARSNHVQRFIDHVREHHVWLVQGPNKAIFSETTGAANTLSEVAALVKTPLFRRLVCETTSEETNNLIDVLEKRLSAKNQNTVVLYSLEEIEDLILSPQKPRRPKPEYFMLTNKCLRDCPEKNRINRLMQIATNRKVKTRIIDAESTAGLRLTQLGGMVCFAQLE